MRRVKWYGVTWPFSMHTLAKRLKDLPFEDERAAGFVIDHARQGSVEGRFFERVAYQETVRDPRGEEIQFERISFNSLGFRCSTSFPQLQITDAPRSTKAFMSLLSQATAFEISVDALSTNLDKWIHELEARSTDGFRCDAIRLIEFAVNEHTRARVELVSDLDVRSEDSEMFAAYRNHYDRAQIRLAALGSTVTLVLTQEGTCRSDTDFPPELADFLREAFIASWDDA